MSYLAGVVGFCTADSAWTSNPRATANGSARVYQRPPHRPGAAVALFWAAIILSELTMILIDGKKTAADIRAELGVEVAAATAQGHRAPGLAVILVGEDPASQVYVRNKERACAEAGIVSFPHHLPASTTQQELLDLIGQCNANPNVDGILLQLPLPKGLDAQECLLAIDPEKDVDGFHPVSVGRLSLGLPG